LGKINKEGRRPVSGWKQQVSVTPLLAAYWVPFDTGYGIPDNTAGD
jgi:hypothetical protein